MKKCSSIEAPPGPKQRRWLPADYVLFPPFFGWRSFRKNLPKKSWFFLPKKKHRRIPAFWTIRQNQKRAASFSFGRSPILGGHDSNLTWIRVTFLFTITKMVTFEELPGGFLKFGKNQSFQYEGGIFHLLDPVCSHSVDLPSVQKADFLSKGSVRVFISQALIHAFCWSQWGELIDSKSLPSERDCSWMFSLFPTVWLRCCCYFHP